MTIATTIVLVTSNYQHNAESYSYRVLTFFSLRRTASAAVCIKFTSQALARISRLTGESRAKQGELKRQPIKEVVLPTPTQFLFSGGNSSPQRRRHSGTLKPWLGRGNDIPKMSEQLSTSAWIFSCHIVHGYRCVIKQSGWSATTTLRILRWVVLLPLARVCRILATFRKAPFTKEASGYLILAWRAC